MATVALSTNQQGAAPIPGVDMMAIMTVTPGTSATAGEDVDFTDYFSAIDAVQVCGYTTVGIAGYTPAFGFTPGAAATSTSVKLFWMVQDGAAGKLEPDDGTDLSSVGTVQVLVLGKAA